MQAADEQNDADADRADARPQRNVDRFLLFHRKLERADLGRVQSPRPMYAERALVDETERAGDDQNDGDDFDGIHKALLGCW